MNTDLSDTPIWILSYPGGETIYRAGLAAGRARAIEEAARRFIPGPVLYMTQQQKEEAAAAIRALNAASPEL